MIPNIDTLNKEITELKSELAVISEERFKRDEHERELTTRLIHLKLATIKQGGLLQNATWTLVTRFRNEFEIVLHARRKDLRDLDVLLGASYHDGYGMDIGADLRFDDGDATLRFKGFNQAFEFCQRMEIVPIVDEYQEIVDFAQNNLDDAKIELDKANKLIARLTEKEENIRFLGRWLSGQRRWAVDPVGVMLYGGSNPPFPTT